MESERDPVEKTERGYSEKKMSLAFDRTQLPRKKLFKSKVNKEIVIFSKKGS